ncbi:hypothetical protein C6376_01120 [Streptomyces sp. P3]|nr:hypothetical protein C6376_01120 [Streptomyces sp. P3]
MRRPGCPETHRPEGAAGGRPGGGGGAKTWRWWGIGAGGGGGGVGRRPCAWYGPVTFSAATGRSMTERTQGGTVYG